jgi:uncharacterized protein (TIGR03067 family)
MSDFDAVQGAWRVLRVEQDGQLAADARLVRLVIFDDARIAFRYFFPPKGYGDSVSEFKLDDSLCPKLIETVSLEDQKTNLGIYELEGDSLKLCWNRADPREPPTEFTAGKGSSRRLFDLQRMGRAEYLAVMREWTPLENKGN